MYSQRIPNNLSGQSLSKAPGVIATDCCSGVCQTPSVKKALTAASAPATVADDRGYNEMHDLSARTVSLIFVLRMPTADPEITPEVVEEHGLTPEEFARIKKILGREPNFTELGIFSVMWSEHCSYKNSRRELKKFPTTGPNILVKAGEENAGVVDIGDGWAIAFKIESHNHPSAIEPFQGAATGVGGIIRDIFTMGARPEFCLNSLRFGPIIFEFQIVKMLHNLKFAANRRLFTGVVSGIAHYGNCFGVPTIGGEIYFDESFEGNPLVNVFCLGVLRHEQMARGAARGVGNPVFYVGAETGRDGLAGAAFASRELTEESREDRPAVQVGDPFKEKLLLEACLELLATDAVAGIQDMGAAGLTCSTCETASRGGSGVEIDLVQSSETRAGHDAVRNYAERIAGTNVDHREARQRKRRARNFREMGCALRRNWTRHRRRYDARAQ